MEEEEMQRALAMSVSREAEAGAVADDSTASEAAAMADESINQLHEVGNALQARFGTAQPERRSVSGWTRRQPLVGTGSVCFVRRAHVLESCLSLFHADGVIPSHCQLLFAGADTSIEEIDAFLHRAFYADVCALTRERLFCVLRISALPEAQYLHFKRRLERLYEMVHPRRVRLALVCDEHDQHRISSDLSSFVHEVEPPALPPAAFVEALRAERHVSVVSSDRAGLGKTRKMRQMASERRCRNLRSVPISGHMTRSEFVATLLRIFEDGVPVDALHLNILDVPLACADAVNDMLFELLCLHMVRSSASASSSLVHVPCPTIFIELANTVGGNLLDRLPVCRCFTGASHVHLEWNPTTNPYVLSSSAPDDVQFVCSYLLALDENRIASDVQSQRLDAPRCWNLLQRHFVARVTAEGQQPSFAQIDVFVAVLAMQFKQYSNSAAFLPFIVQELGHPNVRGVVARCLIDAAARFAVRSVGGGATAHGRGGGGSGGAAEEIERQLRVQSFESINYMLLLMQKHMAITIFPGPAEFGRAAADVKRYYDSQPGSGALVEWRQLPERLPDEQLRGRANKTDLLNEMINFLGVDARREYLRANFTKLRYTLTADNCLKMMLVHVRVCAGQPVIVSGETGCGKTSLIKFLLFLLGVPKDNFCVLNVHAGVGRERITEFTQRCEAVARASNQIVWVFFDEVNTSPHLSMVSELICMCRLLRENLAR